MFGTGVCQECWWRGDAWNGAGGSTQLGSRGRQGRRLGVRPAPSAHTCTRRTVPPSVNRARKASDESERGEQNENTRSNRVSESQLQLSTAMYIHSSLRGASLRQAPASLGAWSLGASLEDSHRSPRLMPPRSSRRGPRRSSSASSPPGAGPRRQLPESAGRSRPPKPPRSP